MVAFALDQEDTWPDKVVRLLQCGLSTCHSYHSEQRRIDQLCQKDVLIRMQPPENPYRNAAAEVLDRLAENLTPHSVVGFHCSRLCDDEIDTILRTGMCPLSPESLDERIQQRVAQGDLSKDIAQSLRSRHQAADKNRQMLWFIFSMNLLKDEHGVERFFRSWGGEALYNSHERLLGTGSALRRLGKPCIVEAEIPVSKISYPVPVAEWVARSFLHRRHIYDGHSPDREGYVRCHIGPELIRTIISLSDLRFEQLTSCKSWDHYPS